MKDFSLCKWQTEIMALIPPVIFLLALIPPVHVRAILIFSKRQMY